MTSVVRTGSWIRDSAKAIEYMVIDAMLSAEPYLKIADYVENPKRYVYLTDNLLNKVEESTAEVSPRPLSAHATSPQRTHRNSNPPAPSSSASARATSTKSSTTRSFRTRTRP